LKTVATYLEENIKKNNEALKKKLGVNKRRSENEEEG